MLKALSVLKHKVQIFLLMGFPGVGKGLVGKIIEALIASSNFELIVMSKLIDRRIEKTDPLGLALLEQVKIRQAGGLMKDEPVMATLAEHVLSSHAAGARRFNWDGCIRTEDQGGALLQSHLPFTTLYLDVPEEVAFQRIQRRAQIEHRLDDANPKIVQNRLTIFKRETLPAVRLLKRHNSRTFHRINCERPIRATVAEVLRVMGYSRSDIRNMMRKLDTPSHPAHKILQEALHPKTVGTPTAAHAEPTVPAGSLPIMLGAGGVLPRPVTASAPRSPMQPSDH